MSSSVFSKETSIIVLSKDDMAVANVVVALTPKVEKEYTAPEELAIMDQVDTQFLPHILIVQQDARVIFPNSDSIKHHVYSFSTAKTFELQLYKDLRAEPLLFSNTGIVELGCNIHDWMLGYIFVADTPYFAKTDAHGKVILDVPEGEYVVKVWNPRFQEKDEVLALNMTVPTEGSMVVKLNNDLLPDLSDYEQSADEFSDYE
ncbi:methylamine utilization protein [uncultured Paraglaciecola sp.]|uniref:methylamine utilization protein n=1 Tax=uncultured Paraglaciecola sp. TaxID=1765024 RepID=UPI002594428F|nr:methylamine utilization protein [uncultured Paraglaciecola sp.]